MSAVLLQCAALVGEDQPLCPDLPELDLSELDVSDLDADSFLGGLKWYSDQSEIISAQYGNEASNLFEVSKETAALSHCSVSGWLFLEYELDVLRKCVLLMSFCFGFAVNTDP